MNEVPGSMVVLYVDPNAEAREQRVAWLQAQGAAVHDAPDAESAVGIAQTLKQLDVLVTEGYLGNQFSGFDLRDAVRQRFPALRTVFTSRYELSAYESLLDGCLVIYDPVEQPVLWDAVRGSGAAAEPVAVVAASTSGGGDVAQAVLVEEDDTPPVLEPGTVLGSYVIKDRLYSEHDTETYLAVQENIGRKVALVVLKPDQVTNPAAIEKFRERERVKAAIEHPRIAPLYEALQIGEHHFYTREMPHGRTIEELQLAGVKFGDKILVDLIANVCDAMSHAALRGHHYRVLTPRDVSVDGEHQASIVNVFRAPGSKPRDHVADVKKFLIMLRTLAEGPKARHLLDELVRESRDWEGMRLRAIDLQEEFREHSLLKRADTKEAQDIQASRQASPLPLWAYVVSAVVVLALIVGIVVRNASLPEPPPKPLKETMVAIPAGEFLYQHGEKRTLPAFWIDKHEVTIGQYAEFLDALEKDKTKAGDYSHPDQPKGKNRHVPDGWAEYLQAALTAGFFNNQPININCPVANVDWWDAYAYAKWRGNRLPSEEEWERAARGTDGRAFPWGDDPRPQAANLGADYDPKGRGGNNDGFNYWAAVDKIPLDVTPEGVVGMAGNVEEWTATWGAHPDYPDLLVPVVRGGHFALAKPGDLLTERFPVQSPKDATLARGFRTVRDTEPPSEIRDKAAAP